MRDFYNAKQAGIQGPKSGKMAKVTQINITTPEEQSSLISELELIKRYLKEQDSEDADILLGDVTKASKALKEGREEEATTILQTIGKQVYDIARSIGCGVVANFIFSKIGL